MFFILFLRLVLGIAVVTLPSRGNLATVKVPNSGQAQNSRRFYEIKLYKFSRRALYITWHIPFIQIKYLTVHFIMNTFQKVLITSTIGLLLYLVISRLKKNMLICKNDIFDFIREKWLKKDAPSIGLPFIVTSVISFSVQLTAGDY